MLIPAATLKGIADGKITVAFRRWAHPRLKAGGRLRTSVGELRIDDIREISPGSVSDADARAAGFASAAELRAARFLSRPKPLWRIAFTLAPDPRVALRGEVPDATAAREIARNLAAMSRRSTVDLRRILALIADDPGRRAPDLAAELDIETPPFKRQVRRLKELGLTESLPTGYLLSPRGKAVLAALRST